MSIYSAIYLDGFGDPSFNGLYYSYSIVDGRNVFRKDEHHFLYYSAAFGPYTYTGGYFLVKKTFSQGTIPIEKVKYWTTITDITDIGNAIWTGIVEPGEDSSSSGGGQSSYITDIGAIGIGIIELTFRVG